MTRLSRNGWRRGWSNEAEGRRRDLTVLAEVVDHLWPGAEVRSGRSRADHAVIRFLALPSPASPSVLLPLHRRSATAAVLRSHRSPRTVGQRVRQAALVMLARLGVAHLVPRQVTVLPLPGPEEQLETHLGEIVERSICVGVHLGPPRANRKPILQLVDDHGDTVAFAKLGINDLTRALVTAEVTALRSLESIDFIALTLPRIVHSGRWREAEVLVLSPLDTRAGAESDPAILARAMVELCGSRGLDREILVHSSYWSRLRGRIETLRGPHATALFDAVLSLEACSHELHLGMGAWHGDWTPWNMARRGDRIVLWDWERFGTGVPAGFDALHFELQSTIRRGRLTPADALAALIGEAAVLLAPFEVPSAAVPAVTATYLLEIGTRYLHDGQEEAGSRLGDLSAWMFPHLPMLIDRARSARAGTERPS